MDKEKVIKKIKQSAPAASAIVVAACIGASLSGYQAPVYEAQAQTKETKTTDADEAKKTESKVKGSFDLADGIYKGTGTGYAGEVTVAVTIKDKQITAIDILSSSDDAAFFNRAKAVIDRIIAGQTLDVDVVSGATFSSNGIISAVKNALTGEKDSGETGESQSGNAVAQGSALSLADVQDAAAYKDGTYYGTGTGFGGTLKVKVVVSGGKIASIEVVENHDDSSYLNRAKALIGNIISSQSTNVDVISGATYSSNGLINAVKNALREAEKATNGQITEPGKEEADTSELEKVMKEAEELRQEDYTEATYAVLKTRMEDAQKLLDADKTEISQEDVDRALENLNQALALLEKKDDGEADTTVYKNGIYEGRALCRPDEDEDFTAYNLTLQVTVRDDKIVAVTDVKGDGDSSNDRYILRAANGTSNKKGVTSQLIEKGNTEGIDAVSGATCTSKAILDACENALLSAKRQ